MGAAVSSVSWSDRVLRTTVSSSLRLSPSEVVDDWLWLENQLDNASVCPCPPVECTGGEDSLHRILLRWTKILVLKLVRSYSALPTVLVAIPLVVGLVLGYLLGRRHSLKGDRNSSDASRGGAGPFGYWAWLNPLWLRCSSAAIFHVYSSGPEVLQSKAGEQQRHDDSVSSKSLYSGDSPNSSQMRAEVLLASMARSSSGETRTTALSTPKAPRTPLSFPSTPQELHDRERKARQDLRSEDETHRESGVDLCDVPQHVAIIMDGNRRYGRAVYGDATSGHWDGSRKLLQVAKWCLAERIPTLTVYAFSTENWRRTPAEVSALMAIFVAYCEELRCEALERNIRVRVLSSDASRIPPHVKAGLDKLQEDTVGCNGGLDMNICLSYGSRGELVGACRRLALECTEGRRRAADIDEAAVQRALLTGHSPDPDVLIRTSGECRLSNFLLWQLAYTELFFVDRHWPEFEKQDLVRVIRSFAQGRKRRFGQ